MVEHCGRTRYQVGTALMVVSMVFAGIVFSYAWQVQALYSSERRRAMQWQQVVEDSSAAIIMCNSDGVIEQWNKGAQSLLGWTEAEAVGSDLKLIIPPDRYEKHQAGINDPEVCKKLLCGDVMLIKGYVVNNIGKVLHVDVRLKALSNGPTRFVAEIVAVKNIAYLPASPPPPEQKYSPPRLEQFRQEAMQER